MRVCELRLVDFRNYAALTLRPAAAHLVLAGENGAGKTNILEAVSLLTPGRGLRRATYPEMARSGGSGGFSVRALVETGESGTEIVTLMRPDLGNSRSVRINETTARTADEMLDHLRLLWLTPSMDGLFTGPAADRRRFLDRLVLAIDPAHGRRAADYERAMRSRNRLLAEGRGDDAWLSAIEVQMAELGVAMALARAELVTLLRGMVDAEEDSLFPKADLDLASGYEEGLDRPAIDLEDGVRQRLAASRGLDRAAARTLEGAHRAELQVFHRPKAMPAALSSTGEQKALLIGLILAHAKLVGTISGIAPILLLDEVAAHLDPGRRAALFDRIDGLGVSSFMTGTDASLFAALGDRAEIVTLRNGAAP